MFTPLIPAVVLGTAAHLLKGKLGPIHVALLVFLLIGIIQFYQLLPLMFPQCPEPPADVIVEANCGPRLDLLPSLLLTSGYYAVLALVFVLAGVGLYRILGRWIKDRWVRAVMSAYITLLLLQLWVEVFPWTLLVPSNFY